MGDVQDYPAADSAPTDPFEGLVAAHYQLDGYITSTNKWFWVWGKDKKQRGYQDIDVLAVNDAETIIVSVTGNLDDKVRRSGEGTLRKDMLDNLNRYFERVQAYLKSVPEYAWLLNDVRKLKKVVAYASGDKLASRIRDSLDAHGIELLSAKEIIEHLQKVIPEQEKRGLRTNNQLIKTVQLIARQKVPNENARQ